LRICAEAWIGANNSVKSAAAAVQCRKVPKPTPDMTAFLDLNHGNFKPPATPPSCKSRRFHHNLASALLHAGARRIMARTLAAVAKNVTKRQYGVSTLISPHGSTCGRRIPSEYD
jgi:hypothetical protein